MAKRDYYEVLGIGRNASADEIRKAHRKLVRQYHPDVNKNDPRAAEKFAEVQEAYDVLSDAQKRRNYDQFGHAGVGVEPGAGGYPPGADPFEAFRRAQQGAGRGGQHRWRASPNVTVEDFDLGGGDFADVFEQFFGGRAGTAGRGGRSRARPQPTPRGPDIEHPITLTFEQAARGTTLPLQINRAGRLETIDVKIPGGVKDGSRVRIRGKGQQAGGEPGDLYIITHVQPHAYFQREGLDVSVEIPISLYEAVLGTKVQVPTLDGPVTLTIPPGTSGGSKLRLRGRGIDRAGEKGDQFVVVKVMVPKDLDDEGRRLIEQLQRRYPVDARQGAPWS